MINEAVILLGGMGTRLLPYTKVVSKEMLPIYDNPVIYYLVKELYESNIKRVIFVVNDKNESLIKSYFKKDTLFYNSLSDDKKTLLKDLDEIIDKMEFIFVKEIIKGSYGALYSAKDVIQSDNFIVFYGDDYLPSYNTTKIISIVMAIYLSLNTLMNICSKSKKERFIMTPLSLIAAICFWITALA